MTINSVLVPVMLTLVAACAPAAAKPPSCFSAAATEFEVPARVLIALARHAEGKPATKSTLAHEFGPMRLSHLAIEHASKNIGVSAAVIKADPCQNVRAAAWWLSIPAKGKEERDIWKAVNRYFYGQRQMEHYPMTGEVKRVYDAL